MNLNKVFVLGRVTANPELRTTPGGQAVVSLGVASNRTWTGKDGLKQEEVEFHNVVVFGRQAEIASQFLQKGSLVFVEGRLATRTWSDKSDQERRATEIICENMQLGPRPLGTSETTLKAKPLAPIAKHAEPAEEPVIQLDDEDTGKHFVRAFEDEINEEEVPF